MIQEETDADSCSLLRRRDLTFLARAEEIEKVSAKDVGAIGFMGRLFIQAAMPHSDPKTTEFRRRNGNYTLVMVAPSDIGLPFGSVPRLLLSWISTEAVRTKKRELYLGGVSDFLRTLELNVTGGARGDITRLRDQLKRLCACSISCIYQDKAGWRITKTDIIQTARLWWDPQQAEQFDLSRLTLNQEFFDSLVNRPVAIDLRAFSALKHSSLAMDVYAWLTYRNSYLKGQTVIPWLGLQAQFGGEYSRTRKFREKFLQALRQVATVYPGCGVEPLDAGLKLTPSKPHIPRRCG